MLRDFSRKCEKMLNQGTCSVLRLYYKKQLSCVFCASLSSSRNTHVQCRSLQNTHKDTYTHSAHTVTLPKQRPFPRMNYSGASTGLEMDLWLYFKTVGVALLSNFSLDMTVTNAFMKILAVKPWNPKEQCHHLTLENIQHLVILNALLSTLYRLHCWYIFF